MAAVIRIDQATLPAGVNGRARTDGVTGQPVTLTAVDPHTTYAWRIVTTSDPSGTVPVLTGASTATCTFTPTARESYLIELRVDAGLPTENVSRRVFAIRQPTTGLRYPTPNEDADPTATLDDTGDPAFIAASADNEGGDIFGWSNDATQWYRAFEALTASNLGAGEPLFAQRATNTLQFKSLVGGTNVSLVSSADTITINATDTGEANTASNLGGGAEVFESKVGVDLQFRTLVGTGGVTVTQGASTVTIGFVNLNLDDLDDVNVSGSATGALLYDGGASWVDLAPGTSGQFLQTQGAGSAPQWALALTNGASLGGGSEVFTGLSGSVAQFRSLVGGAGITIATSATELTVTRDAVNVDDLDGVNLTGVAAGDVLYYNGTNWVNLGIGAASEVLAVNAGATAPEWVALAAGGGVGAVVAVNSATYTVQNDEDFILVDYSTTGVCTVTLPAISGHETKRVAVKDRGRNSSNFNIVIEPNGAETIDGLDEYILTQDNDSITFVGEGSEWSTI